MKNKNRLNIISRKFRTLYELFSICYFILSHLKVWSPWGSHIKYPRRDNPFHTFGQSKIQTPYGLSKHSPTIGPEAREQTETYIPYVCLLIRLWVKRQIKDFLSSYPANWTNKTIQFRNILEAVAFMQWTITRISKTD